MAKHLVFLVDCSQSMATISERVYEGLINILMHLQSKDEDIYVSYAGFNAALYLCFTREKAKYLNVLPEPFAAGTTAIYNNITSMLQTCRFEQDDDILFILATDGEDTGYYGPTAGEYTRTAIKQVADNHAFNMLLVALDPRAAVETVATNLGYGPDHCIMERTSAEMLRKFADNVKAYI